MLELRDINKENLKDIINLKVKPEQKNFVYSVEKSLDKANNYHGNVFPFAIYSDAVPVGFVMSRFSIEYDVMFIWQLLIDEKYQNRGFGRYALIKTIEWIESYKQDVDITTTVSIGNKHAEKLYESIGFKRLEAFADETDYILDRNRYRSYLKEYRMG